MTTKTTAATLATPQPVPMTLTANGYVPTAIVAAFMREETARMRTDEHPDRPHV